MAALVHDADGHHLRGRAHVAVLDPPATTAERRKLTLQPAAGGGGVRRVGGVAFPAAFELRHGFDGGSCVHSDFGVRFGIVADDFPSDAFHGPRVPSGPGAHCFVSGDDPDRHLVVENAAMHRAGGDLLVAGRAFHQHQRDLRDRPDRAELRHVFHHHGADGDPAADPGRRVGNHDADVLRGGRACSRDSRCMTVCC